MQDRTHCGSSDAVEAVLRHCHAVNGEHLSFQDVDALAYGQATFDVIMIDEAAQIPVPVLQRIVRRHSGTHFIFATTTRGYEGSGRGFTLRFVEWLRNLDPTLHEEDLTEPIRWSSCDPLERMVYDALLLDAQYPTGAGRMLH